MDSSCGNCSNTEDMFSMEEIENIDLSIFTFQEGKACYCFFVNNLYKWVFNTLQPMPEDEAVDKQINPNPYTSLSLTPDTLRRLVRQYTEWFEAEEQEDLSSEGITFTILEKENVQRELDIMTDDAKERYGTTMPLDRVISLYLEELEEDDFLYTEEEKAKQRATALYIQKART